MEQLTVQLQNAAYPVYIGDGLLSQAGTLLRSASNVARWAVVADENAARLYGDTVLDSLRAAGLDAALYPVPAGESAKALPVYEELCRRILRGGFDRTCGVVSLGGGACGDLAGYLAQYRQAYAQYVFHARHQCRGEFHVFRLLEFEQLVAEGHRFRDSGLCRHGQGGSPCAVIVFS